MMQMSNNELEKLIKEAGDQYQASGSNPDWEKMQALLDKNMPARKHPRRRGFFLFILLFLLMGGAYLYFNNSNHKTSIPVKEQNASIIPANPIPSQMVIPAMEGPTINDSQKQQTPLLQNKETNQKQNEIVVNRSVNAQNKIAGNIKINTYMGEVGENNPPAKTVEVAASPNENENVNTTIGSTTETTPKNEITGTGVNNKSGEKTAAPEVAIAENKKNSERKNTTSDKKKKTTEKRKHSFEFSLVYAPELTTIRFSNIDKPGSNYGLLVGYNISKNLALQTGIMKSKKNYTVNGGDFKINWPIPPPYKLTRVNGYCNMYEIPLNIKYQISRKKKINTSAIAGISSYFMTGESYTYQYTSNYGAYSRSRQYSSQKNYWFSIATIGIGFEKEISKKLYVAATPFVKIPFRGMGTGDLKLLSTGINFSLSYRPSFTK